jgi:hypothetical protein
VKRVWKLSTGALVSSLVLINAVSIFAQKKQPAAARQVIVERQQVIQGMETPSGDNFVFVASEMNFDGKLVKGAPYSAQALTETTQTLGDGNRIVNKSTSSVYRDSEGRTRREQTIRALGPFATAGEPPQMIFISDPVAGVNYSLDAHSHVARKMPLTRFEIKSAPSSRVVDGPSSGPTGPLLTERAGMPPDAAFEKRREEGMFLRSVPPPPPGTEGIVMEWHGNLEEKGNTESLGKQIVEGIEAEGTKNTLTIPAGAMGNERPIEVVSERWYSTELQTVVMSRHSDPRFGETVYRLTNINRNEPAASLFEVPFDYTVREGPPMPEPMRMRKPATPQ